MPGLFRMPDRAAGLAVLIWLAACPAFAADRPNVLLIVSDDMRGDIAHGFKL
jgi:hypothetical protein